MIRSGIFILGLTGGIGMGKSSIASMFRDLGVLIIDSDVIVHELLAFGGGAVESILRLCPEARLVDSCGAVGIDRRVLGEHLSSDIFMKQLEGILHPLISVRRSEILANLSNNVSDNFLQIVVIDAALLFEKGVDSECDYVIVVSAGEDLQRQRAMARTGMSEVKFERLLARQMCDAERCSRGDIILDTRCDLAKTRQQVREIFGQIIAGKLAS